MCLLRAAVGRGTHCKLPGCGSRNIDLGAPMQLTLVKTLLNADGGSGALLPERAGSARPWQDGVAANGVEIVFRICILSPCTHIGNHHHHSGSK